MIDYKKDFPVFQNENVVFLDSAASTQKPKCVLDTLYQMYASSYANVHRGSCALANRATERYEQARESIASFIHAPAKQVIFTKGATESINLVASGYAKRLKKGDEVLVSVAAHHANFVPWQQACLESGATFKTFQILPSGEADTADFEKQLTPHTKMVALTHISNVSGVENNIRDLTKKAHEAGAEVLVDGAQSVAHQAVDVSALDCDYFAFSGHKLYGPTGIGVLYGKEAALNALSPYQFGGDMIREVSIEKTTFADLPNKFEAGTPPFVQAVGLAVAVDYVNQIGMAQIEQREKELTRLLVSQLQEIENIEFIGNDPALKKGIVSFVIQGIHPSDIAFLLAQQHICVRVGHHCAMPIHKCFHQSVSVRVSLGVYNDTQDIELFMTALHKAIRLLK